MATVTHILIIKGHRTAGGSWPEDRVSQSWIAVLEWLGRVVEWRLCDRFTIGTWISIHHILGRRQSLPTTEVAWREEQTNHATLATILRILDILTVEENLVAGFCYRQEQVAVVRVQTKLTGLHHLLSCSFSHIVLVVVESHTGLQGVASTGTSLTMVGSSTDFWQIRSRLIQQLHHVIVGLICRTAGWQLFIQLQWMIQDRHATHILPQVVVSESLKELHLGSELRLCLLVHGNFSDVLVEYLAAADGLVSSLPELQEVRIAGYGSTRRQHTLLGTHMHRDGIVCIAVGHDSMVLRLYQIEVDTCSIFGCIICSLPERYVRQLVFWVSLQEAIVARTQSQATSQDQSTQKMIFQFHNLLVLKGYINSE